MCLFQIKLQNGFLHFPSKCVLRGAIRRAQRFVLGLGTVNSRCFSIVSLSRFWEGSHTLEAQI